MSRWIANLPTKQVVYFAACEVVYRGLVSLGLPLEPLGQHFEILAGYAFKSGDYQSTGTPLLRNINVKPDRIDWTQTVYLPNDKATEFERFRLNHGDLVLSMDGTFNKQGIKIAFLTDRDVPSLLLQRVCRFDPEGAIEKRFLYHVLHTTDFLDHLDESNRSIAIPHVSPGQLKSFPIPVLNDDLQSSVSDFLDAVRLGGRASERPDLPKSLSEQRRVVTRIEELAAQIHEARSLRHQAAEEADALLTVEERKVWSDESLRNLKTLSDVTVFLARGRQSEQGESEHFLIKTQHVQQGRYLPTLLRLAPHAAAKVKGDAQVKDGDILIACSAAGCLGRVARYSGTGKAASTDTHVAIARPNAKLVDGDYLYAYLRGAHGQ
jgi:hypothetical protein